MSLKPNNNSMIGDRFLRVFVLSNVAERVSVLYRTCTVLYKKILTMLVDG